MTTSSTDQIIIPELNDSVELPIKDIKQLPTPSRTVSLDLPEIITLL